mmetsp:Transcript_62917/g.73567  ORF Transcript_62917/g.73567 Transcript_62917/m.73567 type:complete len:566 (+) Transcript_62917:72-1769(+)
MLYPTPTPQSTRSTTCRPIGNSKIIECTSSCITSRSQIVNCCRCIRRIKIQKRSLPFMMTACSTLALIAATNSGLLTVAFIPPSAKSVVARSTISRPMQRISNAMRPMQQQQHRYSIFTKSRSSGPSSSSCRNLFGFSTTETKSTQQKLDENDINYRFLPKKTKQQQQKQQSKPTFDPTTYKLPPLDSDVMLSSKLRYHQRIVSFGDIHGDITALTNLLVTAKVMKPPNDNDNNNGENESIIDENPVWIGGDTICVQVGDVLDRGDDELACYRLLSSLARQANEAGGALATLWGNHEALNAIGLFHYANDGGNAEFERDVGDTLDIALGERWKIQYAGNQPSRWACFEPGGLLCDEMLVNCRVAVVIGKSVFVHAGLTKEHIADFGGISGMNNSVRDWIIKARVPNNNVGDYKSTEEVISSAQARSKAAADSMPDCLNAGVGGLPSPVWMRDYSQPRDGKPSNPMAQTMIDEALRELNYGVERMVMGHTPQSQINSALKGKAWRVDVGASSGVNSGKPEVLEILHGGEEEDDIIHVLTMDGKRVCESERRVDLPEMSFVLEHPFF